MTYLVYDIPGCPFAVAYRSVLCSSPFHYMLYLSVPLVGITEAGTTPPIAIGLYVNRAKPLVLSTCCITAPEYRMIAHRTGLMDHIVVHSRLIFFSQLPLKLEIADTIRSLDHRPPTLQGIKTPTSPPTPVSHFLTTDLQPPSTSTYIDYLLLRSIFNHVLPNYPPRRCFNWYPNRTRGNW